jgi:death-on-curing protein
MISIKNAIRIHNILIDRFGGEMGLRDQKLLESALARPYQTFDNKELYKTPIEKAASLIESLINNHPFIDGNKRFAYVAMRLTLLEYDIDLNASENDKYDFVISIAKGELKFEGICSWLISKQK